MTPINAFRDIHHGKRCFIIGNGPSLRETDMGKLRDEITIGQNAIYKLFMPTYLCSINAVWMEQVWNDFFERVPDTTHKFIGLPGGALMFGKAQAMDDWTFVGRRQDVTFSDDMMLGFRGGNTVTYFSMQLAYWMGFSSVVLIGVDHHFQRKGDPHTMVVAQGTDPDHFCHDYFEKGTHWQLPDLKGSEFFYQIAKRMFEGDGRKIVDATIDGKLDVFEKVDYDSLF